MVKLLHTAALRTLVKPIPVKLLYVPPSPKIKKLQTEIEKLKQEVIRLSLRVQSQQDDGR